MRTSSLFELLADDHRRRVLVSLCQTESIRVPDGLRTRGAVQTSDSPSARKPRDEETPPASPSEPSRQLEVELIHGHLPKLESADLIEWDRETGTVSRGPAFEDVEPALGTILRNAEAFPDDVF